MADFQKLKGGNAASAPDYVATDGVTIVGDGTNASPLSVVSGGLEVDVVHDGSLTGNGTSASPLATVAGGTAIVVPAPSVSGLTGVGTTGSPLLMAVPLLAAAAVAADGTIIASFGIAGVVHLSPGLYDIQLLNQPASEAQLIPFAMASGVTDVSATATQGSTEFFNVRTFAAGGAAADVPFMLLVATGALP